MIEMKFTQKQIGDTLTKERKVFLFLIPCSWLCIDLQSSQLGYVKESPRSNLVYKETFFLHIPTYVISGDWPDIYYQGVPLWHRVM